MLSDSITNTTIRGTYFYLILAITALTMTNYVLLSFRSDCPPCIASGNVAISGYARNGARGPSDPIYESSTPTDYHSMVQADATPSELKNSLGFDGIFEAEAPLPSNDFKYDGKSQPNTQSLLQVDMRLGRWDFQRNYRTFDHVVVGHQFANLSENSRVTLATHSSVESLRSVVESAFLWEGPISVGLFSMRDDDRLTFHAQINFMQKCLENLAARMSFHFALPRKPELSTRNVTETEVDALLQDLSCEDPDAGFDQILALWKITGTSEKETVYPQNLMRNIARKNSQTPFVFLTDVDIIPCLGMREGLEDFLAKVPDPEDSDPSPAKVAYVIPTFEVDENASFPTNKSELLHLIETKKARPYHQTIFKENQKASNIERWKKEIDANEGTVRAAYKVTSFEFFYEPFYVAPDIVPPHDERFVGYGFTKNTQVYEMYMAGYQFQVLSPVFTVHWGLQTIKTRPEWRGPQIERNRMKYLHIFRAEVASRYNRTLSNWRDDSIWRRYAKAHHLA